jgi:hypothetical protein
VSTAAITLRVVHQRVFIVVVYFVIDSVRKLLDTPSYLSLSLSLYLHVQHKETNIHGRKSKNKVYFMLPQKWRS